MMVLSTGASPRLPERMPGRLMQDSRVHDNRALGTERLRKISLASAHLRKITGTTHLGSSSSMTGPMRKKFPVPNSE